MEYFIGTLGAILILATFILLIDSAFLDNTILCQFYKGRVRAGDTFCHSYVDFNDPYERLKRTDIVKVLEVSRGVNGRGYFVKYIDPLYSTDIPRSMSLPSFCHSFTRLDGKEVKE